MDEINANGTEATSEEVGTESTETSTTTTSGDEGSSDRAESSSADQEWLVPNRFRTVEDLKNSYQALESEYGRSQNELARIRKEKTTERASSEAEREQFLAELKQDPIKAIRKYGRDDETIREVRNIEFRTAHAQRMADPDFRSHWPTMQRIAQVYEPLIAGTDIENDPRLLEILYMAAKGVQATTSVKQAEQNGRKKGEQDAHKKSKAQLEGSSGSKGPAKSNFADKSLEVMQKELGFSKMIRN